MKKNTTGIVLFAFGDRVYYYAMYNIAFSIKYHSPDIKIHAFVGDKEQVGRYCPDVLSVCDVVTEIDSEDYYTNNKFDPGKLKVNLYKYLPFDNNLYLDVDAVCIKPIEPLIDELEQLDKYYASHTVGYHKIEQGRKIESMQWAFADDIWEQYKLTDKHVLPAINSSLQWIVKSAKAKKLYNTAKDLYLNNPIPVNKLRMKWGGGQPDELYMNIALCMLEHDPACTEVGHDGAEKGHIHFAMVRGLDLDKVVKQFYFQSYYGGKGFTSRFYTHWLERMLRNMHRRKGGAHQYKINNITQRKHADKK